jgi:hypothetical protein
MDLLTTTSVVGRGVRPATATRASLALAESDVAGSASTTRVELSAMRRHFERVRDPGIHVSLGKDRPPQVFGLPANSQFLLNFVTSTPITSSKISALFAD